MANRWKNNGNNDNLFSCTPKSLWTVTAAMKLKDACSLEEELWQCIKKWRHHFANKSLYSQSYGLSSSHVQICELDHKEGWALKNWCFWTVVLEKVPEKSLDSKDIKPVNPKGNLPWMFIGCTDAEAEVLTLWPPDGEEPTHWKRSWCWKRLKAGGEVDDRGWGSWMASLINVHEFEQALGDSEGQGSLGCRSPWGCKE